MPDPELTPLFHDLEQANITWCVLRLPSGQEGTGDVDLLVDHKDVSRLGDVLARHEFVPLPGWSPGRHFLCYHDQSGRWLWLHVVTEVSFGRHGALRTGAETGCLRRRRWSDDVPVLHPDDAFWVLLLHCVLDKGAIAHRHRVRLQELLAAGQQCGPLVEVVAAVCPAEWWPERVETGVRDGNWDQLEQLGPSLAASWTRRHRMGRAGLLRRRVTAVLGRLRNLRRARGLSVALLGPDGAGKSTLAQGIQESFRLPVRPVYMGLTGGILPRVDQFWFPPLVVLGRLLVFWYRYLLALYHQARGRLVVFDRYIYDAYVPPPHSLSWLRRKYRWIDGHACPAPDLVLVLSAPGATMYERKGEYNPEMLENWRQHFLALEGRVEHLEIVDTARALDLVRADVVNRIWRRYVARWASW